MIFYFSSKQNHQETIMTFWYMAGFPNLFDPRPPCLETEGLIFTMIMMINLRFGLLLVVFYDDFHFPF